MWLPSQSYPLTSTGLNTIPGIKYRISACLFNIIQFNSLAGKKKAYDFDSRKEYSGLFNEAILFRYSIS